MSNQKRNYQRLISLPVNQKEEKDYRLIYLSIIYTIIFLIINLSDLKYTLYVIIFVLICKFALFFYTLHRAELLNRNRLLWCSLVLINSGVPSLILGFLGYKIHDKKLKPIVSEIREKYELEITKFTNKVELKKIKTSYQNSLRKEVKNYLEENNIQDSKYVKLPEKEKAPINLKVTNLLILIILIILILVTIKFGILKR